MSRLTSLVYDYAQSWPDKQYEHISPSSLGGCMRSHFYKLKGIKPTTPPNPGALLNFELGRLWETPIENAFRLAGLPFISQLKLVDEEFGVGGTLDIALFDVETEQWELISIKTESIKATNYRKREGKSFFAANPRYAIQEATYKYLMEANGFKVKNSARYILITKDNALLDEPVLVFSDKLMEKTLTRIARLRTALDSSEVPDCECDGWEVNYCQFGDPDSIEKNKTGKSVPTKCCSLELYDNN